MVYCVLLQSGIERLQSKGFIQPVFQKKTNKMLSVYLGLGKFCDVCYKCFLKIVPQVNGINALSRQSVMRTLTLITIIAKIIKCHAYSVICPCELKNISF